MANSFSSQIHTNVVDWVLAAFTLLAVLVAIFQEHIKRLFWKPKIVLEFHARPPDCQKTIIHKYTKQGLVQASAQAYYFRIRVKNNGSISADYLELQASQISKLKGKSFIPVEAFAPMNFLWSHTHERYLESLSPNMEKLCDLFHIIDPVENAGFIPMKRDGPVMWFDLEVNPSNHGNLVSEPGLYRLDVVVGASNIKRPVKKSMLIKFTGKWNYDEETMIGKEVDVSLIDK